MSPLKALLTVGAVVAGVVVARKILGAQERRKLAEIRPANETKKEVIRVTRLEYLNDGEKRDAILKISASIDTKMSQLDKLIEGQNEENLHSHQVMIDALFADLEAGVQAITLVRTGDTGTDWDSALAEIFDNDSKESGGEQ